MVGMERRKYRRRTDDRTERNPLLIALVLAMLAVIIIAAFKLGGLSWLRTGP